MSLEHWVWLGLATQPGNRIIDDILRVFPDPEEFFLSGDSGIEKVGTIKSADALRIRATSLELAKHAVETAENYGAKIITKMSRTNVTLAEMPSETCTPLWARSSCFAPKFCPTKVVAAMEMACGGRKRKASSLL